NPRSEPPLKTSSHTLRGNTGTTSDDRRGCHILSLAHIGEQITPSCLDHGLCVPLTIHYVPRINRGSCCSALKASLKCSLTRSNKSRVHLLELISRPNAVAQLRIEVSERDGTKSMREDSPDQRFVNLTLRLYWRP